MYRGMYQSVSLPYEPTKNHNQRLMGRKNTYHPLDWMGFKSESMCFILFPYYNLFEEELAHLHHLRPVAWDWEDLPAESAWQQPALWACFFQYQRTSRGTPRGPPGYGWPWCPSRTCGGSTSLCNHHHLAAPCGNYPHSPVWTEEKTWFQKQFVTHDGQNQSTKGDVSWNGSCAFIGFEYTWAWMCPPPCRLWALGFI